jgi:hypothetical protein
MAMKLGFRQNSSIYEAGRTAMLIKKTNNKITTSLTIILSLALLSIFAVSSMAQDDPLIGTWKLNIAKSTFHFSQAPKSNVHNYQPFGTDGVKATADVVDADGKKIHFTYSLKFDGKFYPVIGDPARDMTSLKRSDVYTGEGANINEGKVINTSRHVLSKDGKTLTVTLKGVKGNDIRIYEKQ